MNGSIIPLSVRWPMRRFTRWLGVVPEAGDTIGWVKHFLIRGPVSFATVLALVGSSLLVTPLQLRMGHARIRYVPVWVALFLVMFGMMYFRSVWFLLARRRAVSGGAVPYAVVRIRRSGVLIKYGRSRVMVKWSELVKASGGAEGFELFWRPDRGFVGVHVSPSQSSLLPSGDLPDDESMAAWINQILADRRIDERLG